MAYIDPNTPISDRAFNKLADDAGFYQVMGGYSTQAQLNKTAASRAFAKLVSGVVSTERPESVGRDAVIAQINANWAKQVPMSELSYATQQQRRLAESAAGAPGTQQGISMEQRNIATAEALANAKAAPGPGRSAYDQRLQQMMLGSFTPDDPSYQWRMEQGMNNLARSGAAKGMLGSGNMAAELLSFGQEMASQEYGAQFNRLLQASANATQHYTAAYGVLDRMLAQQQSQQGFGLQQEQLAQEWARVGQGWNNQNLGMFANDTSRWDAGNRANADAGKLSLEREKFAAQEKRLDNWNQGQGAALMQNAGQLEPKAAPSHQQPASGSNQQTSYYTTQATGPVYTTQATGPVLNSTASQMPSGSGYIQNNSTGAVTQLGGQGNSYGYDAVYGD